MNCRLCSSNNNSVQIKGKDKRNYFLCNNCKLINVYPEFFLDESQEKIRYREHQNGLHHEGYVKFLNRAVQPALKFLNEGMTGLDYGCGYAPTISKILSQNGLNCENYDPIFFNKELNKKYDFIFSTEVFEHFFYPLKEIETLTNIIKTNGLLIVMTERWNSEEDFNDWYYTTDPTHVTFYHTATFNYICEKFLYEKLYDDGNRVLILRKL